MGNEWQTWYGHRVGRGGWRGPHSHVPVVRFGRRRSFDEWRGSATVIGLSLIGLAVIGAVGAGWWLAPGDDSGGWSNAPIEWNEVQAVPRAALDPDDAAWLERGRDVATDKAGASGGSAPVRASFGLCHTGGGTNCVVDGDTIWFYGHNIRIADIDAPETHEPRCAGEQALGDRATRRLHALVNSGAVTIGSVGRNHDRYGRKLRIVAVDGVSVGETLVGEGLARWYAGGRRPWC